MPVLTMNYEFKEFEFDGRRFVPLALHHVAVLDMVRRARDGDRVLARLLDAIDLKMNDADGKPYWPPERKSILSDPDHKEGPIRLKFAEQWVYQEVMPVHVLGTNGEIGYTKFFIPGEPEPFLVPRKPGWRKLSNDWMAKYPRCELCGSEEGCVPHHVLPVHKYPDLELDRSNLITLCPPHHLTFGHLNSWRSWNVTVIEDVRTMKRKIAERP